jgi:site-specific DNA-methyltransferase (adenine-specific)
MDFVLHGLDSLAFIQQLEDGSVDLAVTDPAYESLEKWRKQGSTTRLKRSKMSSNRWFAIFPNDRFPDWFRELYRVMKKDSHVYVLCDEETRDVIKPVGEEVGFRYWKAIIWDKLTIGMGYHYRARVEWICFFEKGKRRLNDLGIPDLLQFPEVEGSEDWWRPSGPDIIPAKRLKGKDVFPTEKPVELLDVLIRQSSRPGELVIDPFMGSGSAGEAALQRGCRFMGTDTDDYALDWASRRLQKLAGTYSEPAPDNDAETFDINEVF